MMKDFKQKQEVWRWEVEERNSKSFDELKTLMGGLSLQNQEVLVNQGAHDGSTPSAATTGKIYDQQVDDYIGHLTKVEFPKFDGTGLDGWLLCAKYFFEVDRTTPEFKVRMAALHLEGKAIQ